MTFGKTEKKVLIQTRSLWLIITYDVRAAAVYIRSTFEARFQNLVIVGLLHTAGQVPKNVNPSRTGCVLLVDV